MQRSQDGSDRAREAGDTGGSWSLPAGYEGKRTRREVAHFLHEPFQFTVVLDPLPVEDEFVFGELQADGLSAGLAPSSSGRGRDGRPGRRGSDR